LGKSEKIKEVSIKLFAERGFDGTNIPLIAANASVSTGTIYRYFESKENLLNIIMQEEMESLKSALKDNLSEDKEIGTQIKNLIHMLLSYSESNFYSIILINSHNASLHIDDNTKAVHYELINFISSITEVGHKKGEITKGLPTEIIVQLIFGAIVEITKGCNNGENPLSDELKSLIVEGLWKAIIN
jgi:TetR/AcrR family transcriptional regulator, repressor of fatR-cypB operon